VNFQEGSHFEQMLTGWQPIELTIPQSLLITFSQSDDEQKTKQFSTKTTIQ